MSKTGVKQTIQESGLRDRYFRTIVTGVGFELPSHLVGVNLPNEVKVKKERSSLDRLL